MIFGQALALELLLVGAVVLLEVLLLDVVQAVLDLLVSFADVRFLWLLRELVPLDEELNRLLLQLLVLLRAGLREGALLLRVALLRLVEEAVEVLLGDRLVADRRDVVARHGAGARATAAPAAAGGD